VFENAAILEDVEGFTASLIVERSATDVDRLEYSCNPDTVNQFRILAGVIAFKL
jgi:phage tail sheath gpL-like